MNFFQALTFSIPLGYLVLAIFGRSLLGDERALFANAMEGYSSEIRARVAAAIERRLADEKIEVWPSYAAVGVLLGLALCGYARYITLAMTMALQMVVLLAAVAFQVLRATRATTAPRIATLKPRTAMAVVPFWVFLAPLVSVGFGIYVSISRGDVASMTIALGACVGAVAAGYFAAFTPAIVGGEDPATDMILDYKIRGSRIRQLVLIAAYGPLLVSYAIQSATGGDHEMSAIWMIYLTFMMVFSARGLKFTKSDAEEMVGVK
jgi:hypothetical protein